MPDTASPRTDNINNTDSFNVLSPEKALQILLEQLPVEPQSEEIATSESLGRITASEILCNELLPGYPRAAIEGYAVRARDTSGATESFPTYLEVIGEVPMGRTTEIALASGQATIAHTGGMLARDADAVVMTEQTQRVDDKTIEVLKPVEAGDNVVQPGEDAKPGDAVIQAGVIIRPQDIGGLMALGITSVKVTRRLRVAIVSTGDELVPPDQAPGAGQIRDINTYSLSAMVAQCGAVPVHVGLVGDDYDTQRAAALKALELGDMLVLSAGSSPSVREATADVLDSLGKPGVMVRELSIRPGSATIAGIVDGKPVFGLPGNPVSALVAFDLLVRPTLYAMSGCAYPPQPKVVQARLVRNIQSATGREDLVQVRVFVEDGEYYAEPIFGKSNLIYTLVRADGVVRMPSEEAGLYSGETVPVRLY